MKKHLAKPVKKRNDALIRLRNITGKTQTEFATLLGVGVDLIKGVESGRNALSYSLLRSITMATGVAISSLTDGSGFPRSKVGGEYTKEHFEDWNKRLFPTDEATVWEKFDATIAPDMLLLMLASVRQAALTQRTGNLTNILESWSKWFTHAVSVFDLVEDMQAILNKFGVAETREATWGEWRKAVEREDEAIKEHNKKHPDQRLEKGSIRQWWGFKNDPAKKDSEKLKLTYTSHHIVQYIGAWCGMGDLQKRLRAAKGTFGKG